MDCHFERTCDSRQTIILVEKFPSFLPSEQLRFSVIALCLSALSPMVDEPCSVASDKIIQRQSPASSPRQLACETLSCLPWHLPWGYEYFRLCLDAVCTTSGRLTVATHRSTRWVHSRQMTVTSRARQLPTHQPFNHRT